MTTTKMMMVDAALTLAGAGWPVLPLAGKIPRTANGFHDASLDPDVVGGWWRRWPSANVGIALPDTVVVIDIDPRNGGAEGWAELAAGKTTPRTLTAVSGRGDGGRHIYLQRPPGTLSGRRLPQGIDLKIGGKGYVVAPPSIHPATGRPYEWQTVAPVADCPGWLAELLAPPAPRPRAAAAGAGAAPASALVSFVSQLRPGERNEGLFWAACRAVDDDTIDQIEPELIAAALAIGLPQGEAEAVIRSARGGTHDRRLS